MNNDEEHKFYRSLYKTFLDIHLDFKNKYEDYGLTYNDDVIELLKLYKK